MPTRYLGESTLNPVQHFGMWKTGNLQTSAARKLEPVGLMEKELTTGQQPQIRVRKSSILSHSHPSGF